MLRTIILVAVLAVVAVHGFFFLAYGSVDACKAAAMRTINKQQSDVARGLGTMLSAPIESAIRADGIETCYRIALFGESPRFPIPNDRPATRN